MELRIYQPAENERLYCPSTGEIILSQVEEFLKEDAESLIAYWVDECIDDPLIKDEKLKAAWDNYYTANIAEKNPEWGVYRNFFTSYPADEWIAYECEFNGSGCGPFSYSVILIVKADAIFEEDPEFTEI
jgi:hypothetical protein